jgi:hypothetical protein
MRINFANYFVAVFAFGAVLVLAFAWEYGPKNAIWILPFLLGASFSYVFSPQLNWWWYSRRPPVLEPAVRDMIARVMPLYQRLDAAGRQRLLDRVALLRMATDWTTLRVTEESIPADVQTAIAAQAACVTWGKAHFLLEKFEKVVVSRHGFLTPAHPVTHYSELYDAEDTCLMFSADRVVEAFLNPQNHFNVALYEYARAYDIVYPSERLPLPDADLAQALWLQLEAVSGWPKTHVEAAIGLSEPDVRAVLIHHYWVCHEAFRAALPDVARALDARYGIG